jgi:hypothetical protein
LELLIGLTDDVQHEADKSVVLRKRQEVRVDEDNVLIVYDAT